MPDYPFSNHHFIVELDGSSSNQVSEVLGLSIVVEPIKHRQGATVRPLPRMLPGREVIQNITFRRATAKGDDTFYQWMKTVRNNQTERRDIQVKLLNEDHEPIVVWKIRSAFPVRLSWTNLNAFTSEASMEELEVTHEGMTVEWV